MRARRRRSRPRRVRRVRQAPRARNMANWDVAFSCVVVRGGLSGNPCLIVGIRHMAYSWRAANKSA
eukprot:7671697-Pyramimonas_sp.AAC.1